MVSRNENTPAPTCHRFSITFIFWPSSRWQEIKFPEQINWTLLIFFYLMLCSYPPICQIKHAKNMTLRWGRKTETQKKQIFLLDLYVQEVLYVSILYMWLLWYDRLWSWLAKVAWVRTLHRTHGLQKGVMAPRRMQLQWIIPFSHDLKAASMLDLSGKNRCKTKLHI